METWKGIPIAPNYEVSDQGNFRKIKPSKTGPKTGPTPYIGNRGYELVGLTVDGKKKTFSVHRLVMLAHIGESCQQVHHKNGIKTDNRLDNLEYATPAQNRWNGTVAIDKQYARGDSHPNSKLNQHQVEAVHALRSLNWSAPKIAEVMGCTSTNIYYILKGKGWGHVAPTQSQSEE